MIHLRLPFPVSVNAMYANNLKSGKGRRKSARYMTWARAAGWDICNQKQQPIRGWYNIRILLTESDNRRRDPGNFEKGVSDLLVNHGLVEDDSLCVDMNISRQKGLQARCDVIVTPSNGMPEEHATKTQGQ